MSPFALNRRQFLRLVSVMAGARFLPSSRAWCDDKPPEAPGSTRRMPAEWEPHHATWLSWPHDPSHWPDRFEPIPGVWARLVKELEQTEDVHLLVQDADVESNADRALEAADVLGKRVHFERIPTNFAWMRDCGPIFTKDASGALGVAHFRFNGHGDRSRHDLDAQIPRRVSELIGVPRVELPVVLEGGAIDVNGTGTLLTTESCLLNKNRNPNLTRDRIEDLLRQHLGAKQVLWLPGLLNPDPAEVPEDYIEDPTDGHIDGIARFVGERRVVAAVTDRKDEDYDALQKNLQALQRMRDLEGRPLEVIELPRSKPIDFGHGPAFPGTYNNFYIYNDRVIVPTYDDPENDRRALGILGHAFPGRTLVPLDGRDLIWGGGVFHCITQQEPA